MRYNGRCITVALIVRDLFAIFQSKCMSSLGAYVTLMKDVVQPQKWVQRSNAIMIEVVLLNLLSRRHGLSSRLPMFWDLGILGFVFINGHSNI